jgi:hypothetical protein
MRQVPPNLLEKALAKAAAFPRRPPRGLERGRGIRSRRWMDGSIALRTGPPRGPLRTCPPRGACGGLCGLCVRKLSATPSHRPPRSTGSTGVPLASGRQAYLQAADKRAGGRPPRLSLVSGSLSPKAQRDSEDRLETGGNGSPRGGALLELARRGDRGGSIFEVKFHLERGAYLLCVSSFVGEALHKASMTLCPCGPGAPPAGPRGPGPRLSRPVIDTPGRLGLGLGP